MRRSSAGISPCFRTTTARRPIGSSTGSGRSRATTRAIPTSREVGLYDQAVRRHASSTRSSNGGRIIAGQFDDPYQLDEKGIFDLVNLSRDDLGGIPGARRPPAKDVFTGFNLFSIALEVPMTRHLPERHPAQRAAPGRTRPTACCASGRASAAGRRRPSMPSNIITGLKGSGEWVQVGRNALPLFNAGLVGTQRQTLYLRTSPLHDVTNFGADILFPVLVRDAEALGIYKALGVPDSAGRHAQGAAAGHHQRDQPGPADSRSPTASPATSSRSTPRSTRASRTAAGSAAGPRRTAIR